MKFLFFTLLFLGFSETFCAQKATPKLVVGIVVDQMSYDYLYRFYNQFGNGGFKRLMNQGTNFRNVVYNYVPTYTGPGHASIYTGTASENHGIVANDWFHKAYGKEVNCVEDTTVISIGTSSKDGQCSPQFLRANTITDQLKLTYPLSKVIGVSIKDRGAILPAGHLSDGSFWYDYTSGNFITSSFFADQLPTWSESFRISNPFLQYANQVWNCVKDSESYQYGAKDNSKYEVLLGGKKAPTFPYDFSALPIDQKITNFTALPFANSYLTDYALAAMKGEKLGTDASTDFLAISYSTPDIAGHAFGPYSLEMEDLYIRLDQDIAKLLYELDASVGKGKYVVFLTADHAVVPVPEFLIDNQLPGGYLFLAERESNLRKACVDEFQVDCIETIDNNNVYIKKEFENSPTQIEMIAFIQNQIQLWPEVKEVFNMKQDVSEPSIWRKMVQSGYDRERSGELIFILQPGYLTKSADSKNARKGTSHGSAFNYDTHVPVLFYGANIPKNEVFTTYEITDIAATLVHILNVQRPNAMTGKPMVEILNLKTK